MMEAYTVFISTTERWLNMVRGMNLCPVRVCAVCLLVVVADRLFIFEIRRPLLNQTGAIFFYPVFVRIGATLLAKNLICIVFFAA